MTTSRFLLALTIVFLGNGSKIANAVPCHALTATGQLVSFDSATPGTSTTKPITGLPGGFTLVGMDLRTTVQPVGAANPGVGSLWAMGRSGADYRLFVIDPATGAATQMGGSLPGIVGTADDNGWFFGINPATDRIRFMGFQENHEIDPNTLAITRQTDVNGFLNYNGGAFSTSSFGGSSDPFFVEVGFDSLLTSANISSGVTSVVGPLGIDIFQPNGLDIAGDTTLLIARPGGIASLYNVNRATGATTMIGAMNPDVAYRALVIVPATFPAAVDNLTVTVKGRKVLKIGSKTSARIRGTATGTAGLSRVEGKVSGQKKIQTAKGTEVWTFSAKKLTRRSTTVTLTAVSPLGGKSTPAKVRILRRA